MKIRTAGVFLKGVTIAAAITVLLACATSGGQRLTLDTRNVPAVEYLPDEITALLDDLGYEALPASDKQRLARTFDSDKMQFKARDDANVRVEVNFRLTEKLTGMHLYNIAEKTPSAATVQRYQALKQRVQREFGADSVD